MGIISLTAVIVLYSIYYTFALNAPKNEDLNQPREIIFDDTHLASEHGVKNNLDEESEKLFTNINPIDSKDADVFETAESRDFVYRPLYVYKRIHHSKRRITMFNAFAG